MTIAAVRIYIIITALDQSAHRLPTFAIAIQHRTLPLFVSRRFGARRARCGTTAAMPPRYNTPRTCCTPRARRCSWGCWKPQRRAFPASWLASTPPTGCRRVVWRRSHSFLTAPWPMPPKHWPLPTPDLHDPRCDRIDRPAPPFGTSVSLRFMSNLSGTHVDATLQRQACASFCQPAEGCCR